MARFDEVKFNVGGPIMPPEPIVSVMVGGRQMGKTTSLIEAMRWNSEAVLVVHSRAYADQLEHQYMFLRGRVFGPSGKDYIGMGRAVYVDNAELVLASLLRTDKLLGFTVNGKLIR